MALLLAHTLIWWGQASVHTHLLLDSLPPDWTQQYRWCHAGTQWAFHHFNSSCLTHLGVEYRLYGIIGLCQACLHNYSPRDPILKIHGLLCTFHATYVYIRRPPKMMSISRTTTYNETLSLLLQYSEMKLHMVSLWWRLWLGCYLMIERFGSSMWLYNPIELFGGREWKWAF